MLYDAGIYTPVQSRSIFDHLYRREIQTVNPRAQFNSAFRSRDVIRSLRKDGKDLIGHKGCVNTISFSADGNLLMSGSDDMTVKIWDFNRRKCIYSLAGHDSNVFASLFIGGERNFHQGQNRTSTGVLEVVTGGNDADIRHYVVSPTGQGSCQVFPHHTRKVLRLCATPMHPRIFFSCSADGTVRKFDLRQKYKDAFTHEIGHHAPSALSDVIAQANGGGRRSRPYRADERYLDSLVLDYRLTGRSKLPKTLLTLFGVDVHPQEGYYFIVASVDGNCRLFDLRKIDSFSASSCVNVFRNLNTKKYMEATGCAFSKDGKEILVTNLCDNIYVYDAEKCFNSSYQSYQQHRMKHSGGDSPRAGSDEDASSPLLGHQEEEDDEEETDDDYDESGGEEAEEDYDPTISPGESDDDDDDDDDDDEDEEGGDGDDDEEGVRVTTRDIDFIASLLAARVANQDDRLGDLIVYMRQQLGNAAQEENDEDEEEDDGDGENEENAGEEERENQPREAIHSGGELEGEEEERPTIEEKQEVPVQQQKDKKKMKKKEKKKQKEKSPLDEKGKGKGKGKASNSESDSDRDFFSDEEMDVDTEEHEEEEGVGGSGREVYRFTYLPRPPPKPKAKKKTGRSSGSSSRSSNNNSSSSNSTASSSDSNTSAASTATSSTSVIENVVPAASSTSTLPTSSLGKQQQTKRKAWGGYAKLYNFEAQDELAIPGYERGKTYKYKYKGHVSQDTIKGVNFFGPNSEYVMTGSDDHNIYIWDKKTTKLLQVLQGHRSIVNCAEGHPFLPVLASSGIEKMVKVWTPKLDPMTEEEKENHEKQIAEFVQENQNSGRFRGSSLCAPS